MGTCKFLKNPRNESPNFCHILEIIGKFRWNRGWNFIKFQLNFKVVKIFSKIFGKTAENFKKIQNNEKDFYEIFRNKLDEIMGKSSEPVIHLSFFAFPSILWPISRNLRQKRKTLHTLISISSNFIFRGFLSWNSAETGEISDAN